MKSICFAAALALAPTGALAEIQCPGFTAGSGSHYVSIKTDAGKVRWFKIIWDTDNVEVAKGIVIITEKDGRITVILDNVKHECKWQK